MAPLDTTLLYCDHGFPIGGDCWRCWQRRALDYLADLRAVVEAIDTCLGRRGAYSCAPTHDCRCDKDRKISDECVCGADDLTAAMSRPGVKAILEEPCDPT